MDVSDLIIGLANRINHVVARRAELTDEFNREPK